jgi:uncharacterized protein (DUF1697 family)
MRDYAAFLRGINVGGHRVKGPELCAAFEELGCREVSTFRASGNVVFDADSEAEAGLAARIEAALEKALGYESITFLRSAAEVSAIAAAEPFEPAALEQSKGKLQVAMLRSKPSAKARKAVIAQRSEMDRLAFGARELFWLPAGGTQDSELEWKAIGALVGQATVRTMGTVEQIAAKYFSG